MQIKNYSVAMNSAYEMNSVKRDGTTYQNLNLTSKDAQAHLFKDDGETKTLTKISNTKMQKQEHKSDALISKFASGVLKSSQMP